MLARKQNLKLEAKALGYTVIILDQLLRRKMHSQKITHESRHFFLFLRILNKLVQKIQKQMFK